MAAIEYLTVEHLSTKDLIRIFSKIRIGPENFNETPCWNWIGGRDASSYGVLHYFGKHQAHRFMFAWLVSPIPKGRFIAHIDHLCKNRACANPLHLEYVSPSENYLRRYGRAASGNHFVIPVAPLVIKEAMPMLRVEHLSRAKLSTIFSRIAANQAVSWNDTPCWIWTGSRDKKGYGTIWYKKGRKAHRFMYAWLIHPLPTGQKLGEVDHLCRNKQCCNPIHLEFISTAEHAKRRIPQKYCRKRLHLLEGDNIFIGSDGTRACRACKTDKSKQRWREITPEAKAIHYRRVQEWRNNNPDYIKGYGIKNRGRAAKHAAAYRARDIEMSNAKARAWRAANRDKVNMRQRARRAANPKAYRAENKRNNDKRYKKVKEQKRPSGGILAVPVDKLLRLRDHGYPRQCHLPRL